MCCGEGIWTLFVCIAAPSTGSSATATPWTTSLLSSVWSLNWTRARSRWTCSALWSLWPWGPGGSRRKRVERLASINTDSATAAASSHNQGVLSLDGLQSSQWVEEMHLIRSVTGQCVSTLCQASVTVTWNPPHLESWLWFEGSFWNSRWLIKVFPQTTFCCAKTFLFTY